MDKIIALVSAAPSTTDKRDDNFTDRLNNRYTVVLLVASAVLISANMYVGSPITCWAPVHFTGSHTKFANSYCWVKNTYYLPWENNVPYEGEQREVVPYYQWIPFILLGQAIMFYLPKVFWNGLNQKVGVDADNILASAYTFTNAEKEGRKDNILMLITNQLHRVFTAKTNKYYKGFRCNIKDLAFKLCSICACGTRYGNYLSILYIFSKVLYIVNVVGQLFMLNGILATEYDIYGIELLGHLIRGSDWTEAPHVAFPRVTFCDFKIRRLGNIHRYTLQCLLPINMYNEKIYCFLWFWFVAIAAVTFFDLVTWLGRYFSHKEKVTFISKHLVFIKTAKDRDYYMDQVGDFVGNYLKQDGVFLLRLIGQNTNSVTVTDITCKMWDKWNVWKDEQEKKKRSEFDSVDGSPPSSPSSSGEDTMKKPPLEEYPSEKEPLTNDSFV